MIEIQGKAEPLSLAALDSSPARGALLARNRAGQATLLGSLIGA